jgi:hypothetical protein
MHVCSSPDGKQYGMQSLARRRAFGGKGRHSAAWQRFAGWEMSDTERSVLSERNARSFAPKKRRSD